MKTIFRNISLVAGFSGVLALGVNAMGESPLLILNQKVSEVSKNYFIVDIESNRAVTGQIRYGTNDDFVNAQRFTDSYLIVDEKKSHQIRIEKLTSQTSYRYQVILRDSKTNDSVQSDYQLVTTQ